MTVGKILSGISDKQRICIRKHDLELYQGFRSGILGNGNWSDIRDSEVMETYIEHGKLMIILKE